MKRFFLVALMAVTACAGVNIEAPPQMLSPYQQSRAKALAQLEQAVAVGLSADASASISTAFFNHVLSDVDNYINTIGTSIVIPGQSEKHFGFSDIHFQRFNIGSMTVSTAAPNQIVVDINNVDITVPETDFHVKESIFHCKGKFSVNVQGGNFKITLAMGSSGGHITTVATVATSYQKLDVKHKFDHFLCKVANGIVDLLIGNIDKLIDKVIKQDLPGKLGPAMTKSFDSLFTRIPLYFTGSPSVVNQGISVTVDLLASTASFPAAVPYYQRLQTLRDFSHDITISVPQTSMNNIMSAALAAGKLRYNVELKETTGILKDLIPAAYAACPDCKLDLTFNLLQAPQVILASNDVDATANNIDVGFQAINTANGAVVPLFVVNINATLDVNGLTIRTVNNTLSNLYFQLAMQDLSITLRSSSIGQLPLINVIGGLLSSVIKDLAVPAFNAAFQGFTFPPLLGGAVVTALAGVFQFECNILLPPI